MLVVLAAYSFFIATVAGSAQAETLNISAAGNVVAIPGDLYDGGQTGTATFSTLGTAIFSAGLDFARSTPPSTVVNVPIWFRFPSGAFLYAIGTGPLDAFMVLNSGNFSGSITLVIISGSAQFTGATGLFSVTATGQATCATLNGSSACEASLTMSGNGGITVPGGGQSVKLDAFANGSLTFVSGTTYNFIQSGTATFGNLGTATFSLNINVGTFTRFNVVRVPIDFVFSSGAILRGTLTAAEGSLDTLGKPGFSGFATLIISGGTGQFSDATGSFFLLTSGDNTCKFSISGSSTCTSQNFTQSLGMVGTGILNLTAAPGAVPIPNSLWLALTTIAIWGIRQIYLCTHFRSPSPASH